MPRPSHSARFYHPNNSGCGVRSLSCPLCSFLHFPYYTVPLRTKFSSQQPILRHPQPTFLPQCEPTHFTPIQNNRQHYSSVYECIWIQLTPQHPQVRSILVIWSHLCLSFLRLRPSDFPTKHLFYEEERTWFPFRLSGNNVWISTIIYMKISIKAIVL